MSAKEKRQLLTIVIVWLVVGVLGFGYFWSQNPERKLNAVVSSSEASKISRELYDYLREDTLSVLKDEGSARELPEKLSDTKVTEAARESWPQVVNQAITRLKNQSYWRTEYPGVPFIEHYQRTYSEGSNSSPGPTFNAQGNVEAGNCFSLSVRITFSPDEEIPQGAKHYADNEMWINTCVTAVIDKDSGEIVKFRNMDYLDY